MPYSVAAGDLPIVTLGSMPVIKSTIPGVNLTPAPPGPPVPVPYMSTALPPTMVGGTTTVLVEGMPAAVASTKWAVTLGDEPGTLGGVTSGTFGQAANPLSFSMDTFFESEPVVCHTHKAGLNDMNSLCVQGILNGTPVITQSQESEQERWHKKRKNWWLTGLGGASYGPSIVGPSGAGNIIGLGFSPNDNQPADEDQEWFAMMGGGAGLGIDAAAAKLGFQKGWQAIENWASTFGGAPALDVAAKLAAMNNVFWKVLAPLLKTAGIISISPGWTQLKENELQQEFSFADFSGCAGFILSAYTSVVWGKTLVDFSARPWTYQSGPPMYVHDISLSGTNWQVGAGAAFAMGMLIPIRPDAPTFLPDPPTPPNFDPDQEGPPSFL